MNLWNSLENNLITVNTIMFFGALNRAVGNIMITPKQIVTWFNLTFHIDKNTNILLKTMDKGNYSFSTQYNKRQKNTIVFSTTGEICFARHCSINTFN